MKNLIAMFNDESGQGFIEYVILLAFVAVAGLVAFKALGVKIATEVNTITAELP
jgi:Flp pilus assembly pilin Flp